MTPDDHLLRTVAGKLARARTNPPTMARMLFAWTSLPGLALVGAACVAALVWLDLPGVVPAAAAGLFVGAALRDFGVAARTARLWPVQAELFDWPKIDAIAHGESDAQARHNTL